MKRSHKLYAALTTAVVILLIIIFILVGIHNHRINVKADRAIAQYNSLKANNKILTFKDVTPVLADLQQVADDNLDAKEDLHQGLNDYFVPLLGNLYQHSLTNNMNNPSIIYPLLKSYLMLGSKSRMNEAYFASITDSLIHIKQRTAFNKLIATAFQHGLVLPLNKSLISAARSSFKTLPLEQQAYLILLGNHPNNTHIFANASLSYFNTQHTIVLKIYTAQAFNNVHHQYIPETTNSVLKGDWVIGKSSFKNVDPKDVNQLIYNLYLTGYANAWGNLLSKITLKKPKTLGAANTIIRNFLSDNSQIHQLLKITYQNTHMKPIESLSPYLGRLNNFYSLPSSAMNSIQSGLNTFNINQTFMLEHIKHQDTQLLKFKGELPQPIKSWMMNLSRQLWQLGLKQTITQLNTEWASFANTYNETIYNHFPFASNASDTKVDDFKNLFSPNSTFSKFVKNKLMPFVNTQLPIWEWKTIPGFKPTINLLPIQEVAATSHLFYYKGKLDIPYILKATTLSDNARSFTLNNNGTYLTFSQQAILLPSEFQWHGNKTDSISIVFKSFGDQTYQKSYSGAWALFHCFNDASITPTSNAQVYNLVFASHQMQANFNLSSTANPHVFVKGALALPKLPAKLF